MNIHDSGYKKLFSNRTIFRQLIETFVHEPWVKELDFSQASTIDKSFVDDHYKETESDLIYRVGLRGREVYFYVLLECCLSSNRVSTASWPCESSTMYRASHGSDTKWRIV